MDRFQSFAEVRAALLRRLPFIVVLTLLGCIASVYVALQVDRSYSATAVVQIEDANVPEELAGATLERGQSSRRVRLIEQRLMARENLLRIMDAYSLFDDDPDRPVAERIGLMRESVSISEIRNSTGAFSGDSLSGLFITVELGDAEKAASVANELMYSVIDQSRERGASRARDTLDFFTTEERRIQQEINAAESALAAFKQDNAAMLPAGLAELRSQLTDLRASELEIDRQIVTLRSTTDRQREEVQQRQLALLQEQRALLRARIDRIEAQIVDAPEVERELGRLERAVSQLQEQLAVIARRKTEAELGQELEDRQQTGRFEVLETALVPEQPSSRSRREVAMMGGIVSLFGAVIVAVAVELMNPVIRTAGHMERALGVTPVVAVPSVRTGGGAGGGAFAWLRRVMGRFQPRASRTG